MVLSKNLVEHHGHCEIVSIAQRISSPAVVNTSTFGGCRHRQEEHDAGNGKQLIVFTFYPWQSSSLFFCCYASR